MCKSLTKTFKPATLGTLLNIVNGALNSPSEYLKVEPLDSLKRGKGLFINFESSFIHLMA